MTQTEIDKIGVGAAFMWDLKGQKSTRADHLANAYHVTGLSGGFSADLTRTGGGDSWQYRLYHEGNTIESEDTYKTKELALDALKRRLRSTN
jgi:hypothetical protein